MSERLHVIVSGRVQGVGFRMYAKHEACRLGLTGWVKNLPTGEVELVAEGKGESITAFKSWCRHGPPHALVRDVLLSEHETKGGFTAFEIRH